jgi:hypothetical protein
LGIVTFVVLLPVIVGAVVAAMPVPFDRRSVVGSDPMRGNWILREPSCETVGIAPAAAPAPNPEDCPEKPKNFLLLCGLPSDASLGVCEIIRRFGPRPLPVIWEAEPDMRVDFT